LQLNLTLIGLPSLSKSNPSSCISSDIDSSNSLDFFTKLQVDPSFEFDFLGHLPSTFLSEFYLFSHRSLGLSFEYDLSICRSSDFGIFFSSCVDSVVKMDIIEDIKVANVLVPITLNRSLVLDF